jgi:hypothetical protein
LPGARRGEFYQRPYDAILGDCATDLQTAETTKYQA